jgi:KDO2-lipid IV(A) lauroyltransferase
LFFPIIKLRKRIVQVLRLPFEWFGIGLALTIIPPLTRRGVVRFAYALADLGYLLDRYGRKVSRANLRLMFGSRLTPRREAALIRRSYRNMARVLFNIVWVSRNTRQRLNDLVSFAPGVAETLIANQPAITISGHLGNWEILSQACVIRGVPMMSIAKQIGSKGMTACLVRLRSTIGQQLVPAEGALRPMLYALKHGTSLGLLVDQHTNLEEGGTWVDLFGVPAEMSMAPAALARKTQTMIIFAWSRPLKDGRYRIEPGAVYAPDPAVGDAERTQQLASAFERIIRRHPSLWCLNYRRWRYIRPGDDPARYPFYARPLPHQST